jgi:hypothetical protein
MQTAAGRIHQFVGTVRRRGPQPAPAIAVKLQRGQWTVVPQTKEVSGLPAKACDSFNPSTGMEYET